MPLSPEEERIVEMLNFSARYTVVIEKHQKDETCAACTGVLGNIGAVHFILMAGHSVEEADLQEPITLRLEAASCQISCKELAVYSKDEEGPGGADYGIIVLDDETYQVLESNSFQFLSSEQFLLPSEGMADLLIRGYPDRFKMSPTWLSNGYRSYPLFTNVGEFYPESGLVRSYVLRGKISKFEAEEVAGFRGLYEYRGMKGMSGGGCWVNIVDPSGTQQIYLAGIHARQEGFTKDSEILVLQSFSVNNHLELLLGDHPELTDIVNKLREWSSI